MTLAAYTAPSPTATLRASPSGEPALISISAATRFVREATRVDFLYPERSGGVLSVVFGQVQTGALHGSILLVHRDIHHATAYPALRLLLTGPQVQSLEERARGSGASGETKVPSFTASP